MPAMKITKISALLNRATIYAWRYCVRHIILNRTTGIKLCKTKQKKLNDKITQETKLEYGARLLVVRLFLHINNI